MNASWDADDVAALPLWQRPLFRVMLGGLFLLVLGFSAGWASAVMHEADRRPPSPVVIVPADMPLVKAPPSMDVVY